MKNVIKIVSLVGLVAGCGTNEVSDLSARTNARQPTLASGVNEFSFNLYNEMKDSKELKDKNVFISPASVATAFGMVYLGAKGETAEEMASVFGYNKTPEKIGPEFSNLLKDISAEQEKDGYQLSVANRIWTQKDYGWLKSFKNGNSQYFKSPIGDVDFTKEANLAPIASDVNKWASDNTNGRIKNILSAQDIDTSTVILLANAIYFLGDWVFPFHNPGESGEAFRKGKFKRLGQSEVTTTLMSHPTALGNLKYYEDKELQAVELPYKSKNGMPEVAMTILLPKEDDGIKDLNKTLDAKKFASIVGKMDYPQNGEKLKVYLPKWELKSDSLKLGETMKDMGLERAFSPFNKVTGAGADFFGMTGDQNVFLKLVLHKTFIKVDEKGTEAAAVTVIGGARATSVGHRPTIIKFLADHPFVYAIRNLKTGSVLFVGRLMDPTLKQ